MLDVGLGTVGISIPLGKNYELGRKIYYCKKKKKKGMKTMLDQENREKHTNPSILCHCDLNEFA